MNTGFSYGSPRVSDSRAASEDVLAFFQLFFKEFPEYAKLDFHLFGESYAGHYVPDIAKVMLDFNNKLDEDKKKKKKKRKHSKKMNLKTIGVGNGLTDPLVQ